MNVVLHPPRADWTREYAQQERMILAACGDGLQLHHIGSTAVPGLWAKDCIDVLGVCSDASRVPAWTDALQDIGYVCKGAHGIPGRVYFSKPARPVHLHVFQCGDARIQAHLSFVESLRASPARVRQLNQLKRTLTRQHAGDKAAYQRGKAAFYQSLLAEQTIREVSDAP